MPGPHILVVMHDLMAPAGVLGGRILARGGYYEAVAPHERYSSAAPAEDRGLPADDAAYDGLIVLGGPMSAEDDANYPHFPALLDLIRRFHAVEKPVLGCCLGGQLIARAFGERVSDQGFLEFGIMPVRATAAGSRDPLLAGLGDELWLMQWHQDRFDLPAGAELLLTGRDCTNQAFRIGRATYGFQPHPEATADIARAWVRARRAFVRERHPDFFARFEVQVRERMAGANHAARTIADRWLDLVAARRRV
ncbi:MAG: type 1 glutamine amidotransferase [Alphaproteobacteria bacterium]|nr:type 1 glutamine amidotransferase [Alphaproteobacteria bacterium]